ncbi:hypothetical protein C463_00380 [Halorubrum californiense DSM 19288]|uniref:Uncharacterized protein n=1 Tax=Halorubrum californiense DSM 19288 TaxID=1227465 RepID=M0EMW4_9EURY|nr:hypothetical protein C463_00380 [Halorubrum californiense DSM 19288]
MVLSVRCDEIPIAVGTLIFRLLLLDLVLFVVILRFITPRPNCGDDLQGSYSRAVPPVHLLDETVLKSRQVVTESACVLDADLLS